MREDPKSKQKAKKKQRIQDLYSGKSGHLESIYKGRWIKVTSSNLARVRYFKQFKILEVEFKHGGQYRYANVPRIVFTNLLKAKSKGSYFARKIRGGAYKFEKVENVA